MTKPLKSPEQLGLLLWQALRAEEPAGFRDCSIEVVRVKAGPVEWDAELIADHVGRDLARVFAKAKSALQERYGWLDD